MRKHLCPFTNPKKIMLLIIRENRSLGNFLEGTKL